MNIIISARQIVKCFLYLGARTKKYTAADTPCRHTFRNSLLTIPQEYCLQASCENCDNNSLPAAAHFFVLTPNCAEWKCFAPTLLREHPATANNVCLSRGFPFFSQRVARHRAFLYRENSTLSALTGKLAQQVLEVTLAKTRFCFAYIHNIKPCEDDTIKSYFCYFKA